MSIRITILRRARRMIAPAAIVIAAAASLPGAAQAGAYDVRVCRDGYGNQALAVAAWAGYDHNFHTNSSCGPDGAGWSGLTAVIKPGGDNPFSEQAGEYNPQGISANITATAPAGTGIRKIHIDNGRFASYYGNTSGWNAQAAVPSWGWCRTDGGSSNTCGAGYSHGMANSGGEPWYSGGFPSFSNADFGPITADVPDLSIGVVCNGGSSWGGHPCYRPKGAIGAGVNIQSALIQVIDNEPPRISDITGPITWPNTWWKPGYDVGFGITGWDNTGIREFVKFVDGGYVGSDAMPCNYGLMKPCEDRSHNGSIAINGFDGFHTVTIRARSATEYALDCPADCVDRTITVAIDGNAPDAPASRNNGPAWSNANSFALNAPTPASENDPDGGGPQARSPIARRVVTVCPGSTLEGSACVTKDAPVVEGSGQVASAAIAVPGEGAWNARVQLVDTAGNVSRLPSVVGAVVRLDQTAPTAAVSTSPLTIKVTTNDALSGTASIKYRVDGKGDWTTVAKNAIDVTAEAGRRYIEVQATDAAGNSMTKPQRFDITVPDGTGSAPRAPQTVGGDSQISLADRGELNGSGASTKATLTAWFVRKSSKETKRDLTVRTIGERSTASIQGTLINGDNQPIRNARIDLQASIAGGRVETSKDVARTDNEGNFAIKLNKGQTSRKLAVRYVERVNDDGATAAVGLELVVKARVALTAHAPKRGNRWKLSGFVSSGYLTKQGVQVQLQWRSPRDGWTDLRTVRTDAKGRFTYYRRMSGHYRLRARVASTPAYAYKGNVSRTVRGGGRR